jgi:hypothetical protein
MLIAPPALRTQGAQQKKAAETTPPPNGVEVVVLVAGKYNGPDHKSIGEHPVGATLVIASGGYSSYLIQNGYVRPAIREEETSPLAALIEQAIREKMQSLGTPAPHTETPHTEIPETVEPEPDEPEAVEEAPAATYSTDPDRPWLFWTETGVIESVALSLWEAGFISPNRTVELGRDLLLGVKGVGPVTADKILAWAEAHGD